MHLTRQACNFIPWCTVYERLGTAGGPDILYDLYNAEAPASSDAMEEELIMSLVRDRFPNNPLLTRSDCLGNGRGGYTMSPEQLTFTLAYQAQVAFTMGARAAGFRPSGTNLLDLSLDDVATHYEGRRRSRSPAARAPHRQRERSRSRSRSNSRGNGNRGEEGGDVHMAECPLST